MIRCVCVCVMRCHAILREYRGRSVVGVFSRMSLLLTVVEGERKRILAERTCVEEKILAAKSANSANWW